MAMMSSIIDFFALFGDLGPFGPIIVALPVLLSIRIILNQFQSQSITTLPPGPPAYLFKNNTFKQHSWRQFEVWTRIYGDVFTVYLGRNPLIVVGTYASAMEIMERESAITASRPLNVIANRLSGRKRILSIPYGDQWRKLRKALHAGLTPKMALSYEPIQLQGAVRFMLDINEDPDGTSSQSNLLFPRFPLTVTYCHICFFFSLPDPCICLCSFYYNVNHLW